MVLAYFLSLDFHLGYCYCVVALESTTQWRLSAIKVELELEYSIHLFTTVGYFDFALYVKKVYKSLEVILPLAFLYEECDS